jgi:ribonuclease HII
MPDFKIEHKYQGVIAGVDEAGRGPWAGPVVAAAVILKPDFFPDGLNDSKKLTKEKRERLFAELINHCDFGVGIVSEEMIDEINILNATKLAMKEALVQLHNRPDVVLVDGNQGFELYDMKIIPVVKGDALSLSIAAASIIAKVARDKIMTGLCSEFPHYGWSDNAGYGTAKHIEAIERHGICKYHRKSYAPIRKYIEAAGEA